MLTLFKLLMDYFNLTDIMSIPDKIKYHYPLEKTPQNMQKWAENHFNNTVHRYVGIFKNDSCVQKVVPINSSLSGSSVKCYQ